MNGLKTISRVLLLVCGLALLTVLYIPIWRIELNAPQYPEGLMLLIYANKLGGNVDIINGLNHYIGMKTLHEKDFAEFGMLPGIIVFFSVAFMIVGLVGKRKWMNGLLVLFILFGIIAMTDFWRWEYQYGHDLNPDAAIRIPGMAYQPPLIGFKQLLNFGAYSVPDNGGWVFVAAGAVLFVLVVLEGKRSSVFLKSRQSASLFLVMVSLLVLSSCSRNPQSIRLGKDSCYYCKMTISDPRFGAELVTAKGKTYKFDDAHCLLTFLSEGSVAKKEITAIYFVDFNDHHGWINASQAFFLQGGSFQSPMNGNLAAFSVEDSMKKAETQFNASPVTWAQLNK